MMGWPLALTVSTALYQLYFAVFHLRFWKRYRWDFDLRHASDFTRKIVRMLSLVLALQLASYALILLWFREDIASTPIGIAVLLQIAAFWAARLALHLFYFGGLRAASLHWLSVFMAGVALPIVALISGR
jgi:hypothetical protein